MTKEDKARAANALPMAYRDSQRIGRSGASRSRRARLKVRPPLELGPQLVLNALSWTPRRRPDWTAPRVHYQEYRAEALHIPLDSPAGFRVVSTHFGDTLYRLGEAVG